MTTSDVVEEETVGEKDLELLRIEEWVFIEGDSSVSSAVDNRPLGL